MLVGINEFTINEHFNEYVSLVQLMVLQAQTSAQKYASDWDCTLMWA